MRIRRTGSVAVLVAAMTATIASSTGSAPAAGSKPRGSRTVTHQIPLPAENSVQVSELTVHATAPKGKVVGALQVVAKNAQELGSAQVNAQAVAVISPKSAKLRTATFSVWIFVHHFSAVARRRQVQPEPDPSPAMSIAMYGQTEGSLLRLGAIITSETCDELTRERGRITSMGQSSPPVYNFLTDDWLAARSQNLVHAFDTPVEEQIDNAVFSKPCPGAENPADDPPPT